MPRATKGATSEVSYSESTTPDENFCPSCSKLNLTDLFKQSSLRYPKRRAVGSIAQCVANKSHCQFCRFLIQACELAYPPSKRGVIWSDKRKRLIYLANDAERRPWYAASTVEIDEREELSWAPYAWLQIDDSHLAREGPRDPYVCVNVVPTLTELDVNCNAVPRLKQRIERVDGKLNFDLVKSWLRLCLEQHSETCEQDVSSDRRSLDLWVIDVENRVIRKATPEDHYIALSYVWGDAGIRPTSDSEMRQLSLPHRLPKTVEDALVFVKAIGEQYLWVDAYCIGGEHRHDQIRNMDIVYQCADLTILAYDGNNADAGLAGVSRPMEQLFQPDVQSQCGPLMATHIPEVGLGPWDTRAWTMQEHCLSRRCVILDGNQTVFSCCNEYFHDCMSTDLSRDRPLIRLSPVFHWATADSVDLDKNWSLAALSDFLYVYSSRQLTFSSDALNACRGILNYWTRKHSVDFVQGLPTDQRFLRSLMWKAHAECIIQRRRGFPTWSWAGWCGRMDYPWWLYDMEEDPEATAPGILDDSEPAEPPQKKARLVEASAPISVLPQVKSDLTVGDFHELKMESSLARFKLKLVRREGTALKHLRSTSKQENVAVGDHWTLLDDHGDCIGDSTGERDTFEVTDYFFRVDNETSCLIQSRNCDADLMFIESWPWIRDSEESNNWAKNMVGALVLIEEQDGRMMRVGSLVLPLSIWLRANPRVSTVTIV